MLYCSLQPRDYSKVSEGIKNAIYQNIIEDL